MFKCLGPRKKGPRKKARVVLAVASKTAAFLNQKHENVTITIMCKLVLQIECKELVCKCLLSGFVLKKILFFR